MHQQRKRVARQAKLTEEAEATSNALRDALRLAEQAVAVAERSTDAKLEGSGEAKPATDTAALVKAALERLRVLIDQARPLQVGFRSKSRLHMR